MFPATTAAGGRALTSEPSGAGRVTGAKAPPEAGTSGSVRQRTTKYAGRARDRERAVEIPGVLRRVPAKSISISSPAIVTAARIDELAARAPRGRRRPRSARPGAPRSPARTRRSEYA